MTRISWASDIPRYETGVDQGVYYPINGPGMAWNGLVGVSESPSESDVRTRYLDGIPIQKKQTSGSFSGQIEAFTYPEEFVENVLYPRRPKKFGMSYRTLTESGYKIHLVYNVLVDPTQRSNRYLESDPYSWGFTTTPIAMPNGKPSANLVVDSSNAYPEALAAFEDLVYGSDASPARIPTPAEVFAIFEANAALIVVDNGDGTVTITGPDEAVSMIDATTVKIDWPSVIFLDNNTFTVRSY